jgi:UDP-N-acetylglucosamine 3-dehydrogenase
MIRLALISFEHVHAPHYVECLLRLKEARLVAVAEPDESLLARHSRLLDGIRIYTDYRQMLSEVPLDGVIVCSANARHKEQVVECARSGKAVLCEKPIATRTPEAQQMLAICDAHQVLLGICFPMRFSEVLQRAKQMILTGELGQTVAVKSTNHGTMPGGWFGDPALAGGGAIMDHTVHVVDLLRWLFDAEFTQVFAHAATRIYDVQVEDCGMLTLEMNNGVFVTLDTSWSRPNRSFPIWGDVSLSIIGTRGVLNLELYPWTLNFYSEKEGKHLAIAKDGDLNQRLLENFIRAVGGEERISASGLDGMRALEVVEAAYQSVAANQIVML